MSCDKDMQPCAHNDVHAHTKYRKSLNGGLVHSPHNCELEGLIWDATSRMQILEILKLWPSWLKTYYGQGKAVYGFDGLRIAAWTRMLAECSVVAIGLPDDGGSIACRGRKWFVIRPSVSACCWQPTVGCPRNGAGENVKLSTWHVDLYLTKPQPWHHLPRPCVMHACMPILLLAFRRHIDSYFHHLLVTPMKLRPFEVSEPNLP